MAQFKTNYLQRMLPVDVNVVGTVLEKAQITSSNRQAALLRGDFVKLTPATSTVNAYISKATQTDVGNKTATHIIALTDMTMSNGSVPTDLRDYRSSELVGAQLTSAPEDKLMATKKVGLYPIWDWNDIVQDADGLDATEA